MAFKKSLPSSVFIVLFFLSLTVAFQNCGQKFEADMNQTSLSYQSTQACFADASVDACIYRKSAAAVAGAAVDHGAANQYQNYAIQLSELDGSGYLTSSSFIVSSSIGRAQKNSGTWKYAYDKDPESFAQVSAYYYLTSFKNDFKSRTGIFHAADQAIQVHVDAGFAGWSPPPIGEINLQVADDKIPMALDGGIVVNLLAHANAHYATNGNVLNGAGTYSKTCSNKKGARIPNGCCTSNQGCGPAIAAGQADYMTAVYFSSFANTTIGESWAAQSEGATACAVSRDVSRNSDLKIATAYSACSSIGGTGNIYSMGALYASIWWEVRKKMSDKNNFDLFFMKHVELIQGDDTFATIKAKILNLDQTSFSSTYSAIMQAEFSRRGL